jgi:hypothetical protein
MISWAIRISQIKSMLLSHLANKEHLILLSKIFNDIVFFVGYFCGELSNTHLYVHELLNSFKEGLFYGMARAES